MMPRVFSSLLMVESSQGPHNSDGQSNYTKCQHVKCADEAKNHAVAEAMIQQVPDDEAENNTAHRSSESHEAGDGADGAVGENVGREDHHERGPRLLSREGDAEQD